MLFSLMFRSLPGRGAVRFEPTMPPKLKATAELADVQRLSGLDRQDWVTFLVSKTSILHLNASSTHQKITWEVATAAKKDFEAEPLTTSWGDLSIMQRAQLYQEAEQKLREHGITQANERLVRWRLARASYE